MLDLYPQTALRRAAASHATAIPPVLTPPARTHDASLTRPQLDVLVIRELRALQRRATRVNGATPADHPDRQASVELAARMAHEVSRGVQASAIARALGISHSSVDQRLRKHGHKPRYPYQKPYRGISP